MALDVYRSCTRTEKRQVLEAFWRRDRGAPDRIVAAAVEYGPFAIAFLVILALEPLPVVALSVGRAPVVLGVAVLLELVLLASLWWSAVRLGALRRAAAA